MARVAGVLRGTPACLTIVRGLEGSPQDDGEDRPAGTIGGIERGLDRSVLRVCSSVDKKEVDKRYDHINNFEEMLEDNGTIVLKFYLHISKAEQKVRFKRKIYQS